jgi:3-hydroxyisobutyrate dehydrogenase
MPDEVTRPEVAKPRVAFLGLGHMGGPMAVNLVKAGYEVIGFDVVPAALDAARGHGIPVAASAAETIPGADVVLTMFPSGQHVLDAYLGSETEQGLLAAAAPNTMFLDCSTINVDEAREAARLALDAGHRSVDAPVSGALWGRRPAR